MTTIREPVEFTWMPNERELEELWEQGKLVKTDRNSYVKHSSVSSFCQFIRKSLDIRVYVKDIRPNFNISYQSGKASAEETRNASFKRSYYDPLYIVTCEFCLESDAENYKMNLIHLFCSKKFSKESPQSWMCIDMSFITGNLRLENFIAYSETEVCNFALGNLVGLNTFLSHFDSSCLAKYDEKYKITQVKVKFTYDYFELYFNVGNSHVPVEKRSTRTHQFLKLRFTHKSLHRLLICHVVKDFSVYFQFLEKPILYRADWKKNNDQNECSEEDNKYITYNNMDYNTTWYRVVDLFDGCQPELRQEFIMNSVLMLKFKRSEYTFLKHLLEQFCTHIVPCYTPMVVVPEWNNVVIKSITSNCYECLYALKCLLTRSNEVVDQLVVMNNAKEVDEYLASKCKENPKVLAETMFHIYNQMEQGFVLLFLHAVKTLYAKFLEDANAKISNKETSNVVYIKRAILMPGHVCFLPPQPQLYNRILRTCSPDYLMRLTIRDWDLTKVNFNLRFDRKYNKKFVDDYVIQKLAVGIRLGNRKYNYLGMSSSQLKSHSMWCYANDPKNKKTIEEIRKDIGDLDKILEVPKYMARMGQSFSQAMGRIMVPQELTNIDDPENDIERNQKVYMTQDDDGDDDYNRQNKSNKKKFLEGKFVECSDEEDHSEDEETEAKNDLYNFSDGIGRISQEIADQIHEELELGDDKPSAFQVRYAGCKGMLVIHPLPEGKKILFRKSMKKYDSKDDSLEILKISKPRCIHLNRQLITLLEQKGIPKERFMELQKKMIHSLIKSMFYDEDAKEILNLNSQLRLKFDNLMTTGISFTEDPLFRSMILAIFRNKIYLLKQKARIAIPGNKGRNMFGVLDETKKLEYEEVFIQYTIFETGRTVVLKGDVVVTKTPCLHPGDVRKFTAIDVPGLHHVRDCIVFPALGDRPHPDEMAGSDLDGDEYAVIWHEDLIFDSHNSPAMHYAIPKKSENARTDRPIQVSDEYNHMCNYILNDSVGLLANAHLARADAESDGIWSKACMKICQKHAKAVDFAKTGRSANMTYKEMAHRYPDFMEKKRKKTYVSKRALGHLYRNCKNLEIGLEATNDKMEYQLDQDLVHEDWETYEHSARKSYRRYCRKISSCLKSYSIESEGELLSGNFVDRRKLVSDSSERMNFQEMLEFEITWLAQLFEKEFFIEFGGKPNTNKPEYTENMLQKASAWYVVSYSGDVDGETRYFGLPWMVSDVLAALKHKKKSVFHLSSNIFVKKASYVEMAIDKSLKKYGMDSGIELDVISYKIKILDNARSVLDMWLNCQKNNFILSRDLKAMEKHIDAEFASLSERLLGAEDKHIKRCQKDTEMKKFLSPGYYVLQTLINLSEMGTGDNDMNLICNSNLQEFGLCAWITLIQLACSCNVQYLGLSDSEGSYAPTSFYKTQDMVCDLLILETNNEKFWTKYREDEKGIRNYFMNMFKLVDIALHPEAQANNTVHMQLIVKGSRYAVDCVKHAIVQSDFTKWVVLNKAPQ